MHPSLLEVLRCPASGGVLTVDSPEWSDGRLRRGMLVTAGGAHRYEVRDFVPRFVPPSNYADSFGLQWNHFRATQLDSRSGRAISSSRFWRATGWQPDDLRGRWVLDAGCGAGRFAEVALQAGAVVVALDYSSAADACYANLGHFPNLHVLQGDIYALPLRRGWFPYVYSLGVLQHTPDVAAAFAELPPMLAEGGRLCADFYWRRLRTMVHTKYLLRPVTKRMPRDRLLATLKRHVPRLLRTSQALGRVPVAGRALKRLIPVADYTGVYDLDARQLEEWALLDTFDMLAPAYDNPQSAGTVRHWFEKAGLQDVQVLHEGHLVGRGRRAA